MTEQQGPPTIPPPPPTTPPPGGYPPHHPPQMQPGQVRPGKKNMPLMVFAIIMLSLVLFAVVAVVVAIPVFMAAKDSAHERTCQSNMKTVKSASNIYAASTDGTYPGSMPDLVPDFIEETPTCPEGGIYDWNWDAGAGGAPPNPSCDIHGTV
jgi:competence protein ComGC